MLLHNLRHALHQQAHELILAYIDMYHLDSCHVGNELLIHLIAVLREQIVYYLLLLNLSTTDEYNNIIDEKK